MLNGNPYYTTPDYLNENEIKEICAFFQGAVYTWCAINKTNEFATRDFIGGINYYWKYTPLYKLYEHYESKGDENPKIKAGLDAGSLLKKTLLDDKRNFVQYKKSEGKKDISYYEWDGNTGNDD